MIKHSVISSTDRLLESATSAVLQHALARPIILFLQFCTKNCFSNVLPSYHAANSSPLLIMAHVDDEDIISLFTVLVHGAAQTV